MVDLAAPDIDHAVRSFAVLVMSEDPLLRDCLGTALDAQRDLVLAGTSASLTRWPEGIAPDDVSVVVADLGPGPGLAPVVPHVLRDATAGWPLAVLLDDPGCEVVSSVASVGVEGIVARRSSLDTVLRATRAVAVGGTFFDRGLVTPGALSTPELGPLAELTAAERRVLALLKTGRSNTEIARSLGRSVNTVKSQVSSLLRKLDVATRLEAALIYEQSNLGVQVTDHS